MMYVFNDVRWVMQSLREHFDFKLIKIIPLAVAKEFIQKDSKILMKRSFSSSSFGLSQDIPLTSPTMTPFLACHSSGKSYFQENQSCIHNSDCSGCSFDNERDALHDDVSLEIKNDIAKHESIHSSHDHFASDFQHQYQREWNYQDICNHYRDSRQHLLMEQYQEDFFGDINQIYSANSDEIAYSPDNNGTIGHYIDMSLMYSGDVVGVSPGSYLASSHFHMEAIAPAADVVSMNYSEQKSSHSRETMEMGLESESDGLFDQSHSHSISLSLDSEEYEDEILQTKVKN